MVAAAVRVRRHDEAMGEVLIRGRSNGSGCSGQRGYGWTTNLLEFEVLLRILVSDSGDGQCTLCRFVGNHIHCRRCQLTSSGVGRGNRSHLDANRPARTIADITSTYTCINHADKLAILSFFLSLHHCSSGFITTPLDSVSLPFVQVYIFCKSLK